MSVNEIIKGINKSNLEGKLREKVIDEIKGSERALNQRFKSLLYKPPSAHDSWYDEIARETMGIISPTLRNFGLSREKETEIYRNIYSEISGNSLSKAR